VVVNRIPRIILDGDKESSSYMAREGIRQLGILKALMGFSNLQQDIRKVEYIDGSRIVCRSCFGEDVVYIYTEKKEEAKAEERFYVYVTISDYVTIWDLKTGEVAKGIGNIEGERITFPCHKDKLVGWLNGVKDKPTRQVLKDAPKNNRDYLKDNGMDAGNENRIPLGDEGKKGMPINANFTERIEYGQFCFGIPSERCSDPFFAPDLYYYEGGSIGYKGKYIHPNSSINYPNSWRMQITNVSYKNNHIYCNNATFCMPTFPWMTENDTRNVEKYEWRTREFHLEPSNFAGKTSSELILLECDVFRAGNTLRKHLNLCRMMNPHYESWFCDIAGRSSLSHVFSYRTPLGNLVNDLIPTRKLIDNFEDLGLYKSIQEIVNVEGYIDEYIDMYIRENNLEELGLDHYLKNAFPLSHANDPYLLLNWAQCLNSLGCEELPIPNNNSYSFDKKPIMYWTTPRTFNDAQLTQTISGKFLGTEGIDDRYAVSWCESPKEKKEEDWYKIHLFFYTGKVFCRECSHTADWRDFTHTFCEDIDDTDVSEYYIGDRFSSVQATIELEHPEDYKKENLSVDEKPNWVKKYRRPDDFSKLGVFPGRESGYLEDEENHICCPFDGTYDIYTLGEAVEELINNHYKDGSNDQLLVYLYKHEA
jgi:hypothetical protein